MQRTTLFSIGSFLGLGLTLGMLACGDTPPNDSLMAPRAQVAGLPIQILACPVTHSQAAWGIVDPEAGGTVAIEAGRITVPPGAVEETTFIGVLAPEGQHAVLNIRANGRDHFQFEKPVEITIEYSRCEDAAEGNELEGWVIDSRTHALVQPVLGTNDADAAEFTITVDHLTSYIIASN